MPVKYITISSDRAGQRLDNFLLSVLKNVPKSRIYKAIRKGEVRINKSRSRASYKLMAGDYVRVPPLFSPDATPVVPPTQRLQDWITGCVVFENSKIIILNKPAGIPVHSGGAEDHGVQGIVRIMRPEAPCIELVHRLDKGTSGCLVIAKKRSMLRAMQQKFRERLVKKQYFVLVKGVWEGGKRRVEVPLTKKQHKGGGKIVVVDTESGKAAVSTFVPIRKFKDVTLLLVRIETGRTHQIRVHARYLGYPVVGDSKYGCDEFNSKIRRLGFNRMFLHSASILFRDLTNELPVFGLSVLLSGEFREFLYQLEQGLG
jgi:23S rRNA pseudouridine955/2504/2580 synthase